MPSKRVDSLLSLQEADLRLLSLEGEMKRIPKEIAREEEAIARLADRRKEARGRVSALEVRRAGLSRDLAAMEEKVVHLKSQQSLVKKNEEYQALSKEIETAEARCGTLEEEQLGVLFEIDTEKESLQGTESELDRETAIHQRKIRVLQERLKESASRKEAARGALEEIRGSAQAEWVQLYDTTKSRVARSPWVVPLEDQTCSGCHLRVSNEVLSQARGEAGMATCDQCGRIVYLP